MDFNATIFFFFFFTGDLLYVVNSNLKKKKVLLYLYHYSIDSFNCDITLDLFPFLYQLTNANVIRNIQGLLLKLNPSMFITPVEAPELRFFFFLYMFLRTFVVAAVNFCFGFFCRCHFGAVLFFLNDFAVRKGCFQFLWLTVPLLGVSADNDCKQVFTLRNNLTYKIKMYQLSSWETSVLCYWPKHDQTTWKRHK